MRAVVYVNPDDPVTNKPKAVQQGRVMAGSTFPYLTKALGFPVFVLEGEKVMDGYQAIEASPGMVGMTFNGELFVIDADKEVQRIPGRVISEREYDRFIHLQRSFPKEAA